MLKRYEDFKQLSPEEKAKIKRKWQWFKDLSPQEKDKLRQQWQSLSSEEKAALKAKMRDAAPTERGQLRREFLNKHN